MPLNSAYTAMTMSRSKPNISFQVKSMVSPTCDILPNYTKNVLDILRGRIAKVDSGKNIIKIVDNKIGTWYHY